MESTSSTSISHNACIPPILHYCWFGRGEKPELVRRHISWNKGTQYFQSLKSLIELSQSRLGISFF